MRGRIPQLHGMEWGDHLHNEHLSIEIETRSFTDAAVLIPAIDRPQGAQLLFTYRSPHLKNHAGQISFPGGKIDANDSNPQEAALRELHEEIGISANHVLPIGTLPIYLSGSGYRVYPVIGVLPPDLPLSLNANEVESVFEVPLSFFLDANNAMKITRDDLVKGQRLNFFEYNFDGHRIWGVTAGIINAMFQTVFDVNSNNNALDCTSR